MAGRRLARAKGKGKASAAQNAVPGVYREMLAEALPEQADITERPLKKRRTGQRPARTQVATSSKYVEADQNDDEDEEDMQFEDVPGLARTGDSETDSSFEEDKGPPKRQQTAYRDSEDESEQSDMDWEAVELESKTPIEGPSGDLELNLTMRPAPQHRTTTPRKRVVTKEERALRLQTHKIHVLCLLSYVDRRNDWCNDSGIQASLKPLLSKKMLTYLRPKSDLSQFGRTESLKRGLEDVARMWRTKFSITARGMRRSLWAENERDLQNFNLPSDSDTCFDKSDFRAATKELKGSRDLGAQLYCALLRSASVETRLVCSLQPLSFTATGPAMPRSSTHKIKEPSPEVNDESEGADIQSPNSPFATAGGHSTGAPFSEARRRFGHPNAADYHLPDISAPIRPPPKLKTKTIHESAFPVFWVEVLDEAHQKWLPVDPLVTETIAKPRSFEPPAADRENNMSYVIAFEEEGTARDITRRYAKAYNAKTRKNRVESTHGGDNWWRRTMRQYSRGWKSDLDQIEDTELAATEAREPMPKNVADFKDHPYYALERHLRRNEVLVGNREVGKVAAGRDPSTPGQKKLESIFRRRDVKAVRSADAWYRLGREIKDGEQPLKMVEPKRKPEDIELGEDAEERAGTNLYSEDQTEVYKPPPIVNGRVPKNSYGNLDVFVPSMVPKGGVHIPYDEASKAARILGIDYSDALTGFEFRGRHGTAVLKGVVVASEYREAVEAAIEGFRDERAQEEEQRRMLESIRMWKRFLVGLRIKERVDTYEVEGEEPANVEIELNDDDDDEGMQSEEYVDEDFGGGFFPE